MLWISGGQLREAHLAWFKDALAGIGLILFFASGLILSGAGQSLLFAG